MKDTILQMVVIADRNCGKNKGKTNCGNEELVLFARAIKEGRTSRRRRPQMQFNSLLFSIVAYSQRNITVPYPVPRLI